MLLAVWSDEAAIENEQDIVFFTEASQFHGALREIHQCEIGGGGVNLYSRHYFSFKSIAPFYQAR